MRSGVEIAIVIGGLVQDLHIVVGSSAPFDQWEHGSRVRLEHSSILIDSSKNGRTDWEHNASGVIAGCSEHMMNQLIHSPMATRWSISPTAAARFGLAAERLKRDLQRIASQPDGPVAAAAREK